MKPYRIIKENYMFIPYSDNIFGNEKHIISENDFKSREIELMKEAFKRGYLCTFYKDKIIFYDGNAIEIFPYKNDENILDTLRTRYSYLKISEDNIKDLNDITNLEEALYNAMKYTDDSYDAVSEKCKQAIKTFAKNIEKTCGKYVRSLEIEDKECYINQFCINYATFWLVFQNYLVIIMKGSDD